MPATEKTMTKRKRRKRKKEEVVPLDPQQTKPR